MGPLYKYGWFDFTYSLQIAGLVGFFFGFVLERAGFGNARKLTDIFYLRDFAVLKVMFTAIVVCVPGLLYFSLFGWIDLTRVYILPTYIWPQIVGGFILGAGFVMGGYCPATSIVATVSGKLDGLIFLLGMVLGSFVFAELFPVLKSFYNAGSMGPVRLPEFLGIRTGVVALLVAIMAVGAFWVAEKVEQRFGDSDALPKGSRNLKMVGAGFILLLGFILAIGYPEGLDQRKPDNVPALRPGQKTPPIVQQVPKGKAKPFKGFKIVEDEGC